MGFKGRNIFTIETYPRILLLKFWSFDNFEKNVFQNNAYTVVQWKPNFEYKLMNKTYGQCCEMEGNFQENLGRMKG